MMIHPKIQPKIQPKTHATNEPNKIMAFKTHQARK